MPVKKELKSSIPLKKEEVKKEKPVKEAKKPEAQEESSEVTEKMAAPKKTKKVCQFCAGKTEPKYWDSAALRRFITDRGRIAPRGRHSTCAKHQRRLSREIKRARHLALLPFTVRI